MANALYDKGREGFLNAEIDWSGDDIRMVLVDTGAYTPDLANDEFLSDIPGGARVASSGSFTNKTSTNGVADADDTVFSAVAGPTVEAGVIYQHTGVDATSRLIAFIDTAVGLPVTPSGADITVRWDSGANRIFRL